MNLPPAERVKVSVGVLRIPVNEALDIKELSCDRRVLRSNTRRLPRLVNLYM